MSFPGVTGLSGSVRALGLGGAYQVGGAGSDAVFHFPSVIGGGLDVQGQRWGAEGSTVTLSAAREWRGGTVALAVSTLSFSGLGHEQGAAGQEILFSGGTTPLAERTALVAYASGVKGIELGAVAKLSEERVGTSSKLIPMLDVGASTELGPVTVAASYQNVGREVAEANPRRLRLGVGGYGQQLGILDLGFAAEVSRVMGEWVPGVGVELGYWPVSGRTFVARVGLRRIVAGEASPLTLGFSFWGDDIVLEWAFQPVEAPEGAGTHRLGLGWR